MMVWIASRQAPSLNDINMTSATTPVIQPATQDVIRFTSKSDPGWEYYHSEKERPQFLKGNTIAEIYSEK